MVAIIATIIKITINIPTPIPALKIPPTTVQELSKIEATRAVKKIIMLVVFIKVVLRLNKGV